MALEANDLKQIADLIKAGGEEVTKGLSNRLRYLEEAEAPDIAAIVAKALADDKAAGKKGSGEGEDDKGGMSVTEKARFTALETQLKEQKEATQAADTARKEEKMLSALRSKLIAKKVPAVHVDTIIAVLHHRDHRIALDDQGSATIRFQRDGYADTPTLDKGLDEWLGTDAGKSFLPAKQVMGSEVHQRNNKPISSGGKIDQKGAIGRLLGAALGRAPANKAANT